jgi:hypothetical protein
MIDTIIHDFIELIRMPSPGCINKEKCVHCYRELKIDDTFVKGEFCIRFENWPKKTIVDICNGTEICNSFMDRKMAGDNYTSVILRSREFSWGVLDLNKVFG